MHSTWIDQILPRQDGVRRLKLRDFDKRFRSRSYNKSQ